MIIGDKIRGMQFHQMQIWANKIDSRLQEENKMHHHLGKKVTFANSWGMLIFESTFVILG